MGFRDQVKRLKRDLLRSGLDSFELAGGGRFYFNPSFAGREVFLHVMECLGAQAEGRTTFPEPPPVIKAIARARDREAAFEKVFAGGFLEPPYDRESLVERGEFLPVTMAADRELGEVIPDLSE